MDEDRCDDLSKFRDGSLNMGMCLMNSKIKNTFQEYTNGKKVHSLERASPLKTSMGNYKDCDELICNAENQDGTPVGNTPKSIDQQKSYESYQKNMPVLPLNSKQTFSDYWKSHSALGGVEEVVFLCF